MGLSMNVTDTINTTISIRNIPVYTQQTTQISKPQDTQEHLTSSKTAVSTSPEPSPKDEIDSDIDHGIALSSFPFCRGPTYKLINRDPCYHSTLVSPNLQEIYDEYEDELSEPHYAQYIRGCYLARKPNGTFCKVYPDPKDQNYKYILSNHYVPFYDCRKDKLEFSSAIRAGKLLLSRPQLSHIDRGYHQFKQWVRAEGPILYDILHNQLEIPVGQKRKDYRKYSPLLHEYTLQEHIVMARENLRHVKPQVKDYIWLDVNDFPQSFQQKSTAKFSYRNRIHPVSLFLYHCEHARQTAHDNLQKKVNQASSHRFANDISKNNPIDIRLNVNEFLTDIQGTRKRLRNVFPTVNNKSFDVDRSRAYTMRQFKQRLRGQCVAKLVAKKTPYDVRFKQNQFKESLLKSRHNLIHIPLLHEIVEYRTNICPIECANRAYLAHRVSKNCQPWQYSPPVPYNAQFNQPASRDPNVESIQVVKQDQHGRNLSWITPTILKNVVLNTISIGNLPIENRTINEHLQLQRFNDWVYRGEFDKLVSNGQQKRRGSIFETVINNIKNAIGFTKTPEKPRRDHDHSLRHRVEPAFLEDLEQFVMDIQDVKTRLEHVDTVVKHRPCVILDENDTVICDNPE